MNISRRGFLIGATVSAIAAPAIVRAASIMPVKAIVVPTELEPVVSGRLWAIPAQGGYFYTDELSEVLRQQIAPLTKFESLCRVKSLGGIERRVA